MSAEHPFTHTQLDDIAGGLFRSRSEFLENARRYPQHVEQHGFWLDEARRIDATLDLVEGVIKRREFRDG